MVVRVNANYWGKTDSVQVSINTSHVTVYRFAICQWRITNKNRYRESSIYNILYLIQFLRPAFVLSNHNNILRPNTYSGVKLRYLLF